MNVRAPLAPAAGTKVPATPKVCPTTGLDADVCFGGCCATSAGTEPTFAEQVAYTLHRAAAAYRVGEIGWGREWFIRPDDACRCALGAITYAVDPTAGDGNPHYITDPALRNVALGACEAFALYLVHELHAIPAYEGHELDVVETVGNWNDETARDAQAVAAALDAAAEHQA